MKKYSSREKLLLKLVLLVLVMYAGDEGYQRFEQTKDDMKLEIDAMTEIQANYVDSLDVDRERLEYEIRQFNQKLERAGERVLIMPSESEAIFKVQEILSGVGERAEINMNSQNKRKSKPLSEETGMVEIRTYFGYDCELENLLTFFEYLQEQPFYMAIESINMNSYRGRRSRARRQDEPRPEREDRIRGSVVISTLFHVGPEEMARLKRESAVKEEEEPEDALVDAGEDPINLPELSEDAGSTSNEDQAASSSNAGPDASLRPATRPLTETARQSPGEEKPGFRMTGAAPKPESSEDKSAILKKNTRPLTETARSKSRQP